MITPAERRTDDPPAPAWITWPVRVVAVLVVVPVRLLWEALGAVGSFLGRRVLAPFGRFLRAVVWQPLVWLTRTAVVRPIAWLCHHLLVVPATWLWSLRHPLARFLHRYAARPLAALIRLFEKSIRALVTYLLVLPLVRLARALSPVWRLAGRAVAAAWRGAGRVLTAVWRGTARILAVPWRIVTSSLVAARRVADRALQLAGHGLIAVGRAAQRWLIGPVTAATGWAWAHTAAPAARWLRATVLGPAAATVRGVLVALGRRR